MVPAARSPNLGLRKLWRSKIQSEDGATLTETLVVLVIMSILAAIAIPQVQKQNIRNSEYQLQRDLIEVRASIDRFHKDWREGTISQNASGISADGYPTNWESLIAGVPEASGGTLRRYLRSIPDNPFASDPDLPWILLGHRDAPDAARWNEVDIFDLKANTDRTGLDGSKIREW